MIHFSCSLVILMALSLVTPGQNLGADAKMETKTIVDFTKDGRDSWRIINDGVMGGLSSSRMRPGHNDTGLFEGSVSLENNGGFASVRTVLDELDLSGYDGLLVRVLGDGKKYRLRLRTDKRFDGVAYQAAFETFREEWMTVAIPFTDFEPTFRGRVLRNVPALNTSSICQLGLMIADKQSGPFRLEVGWIAAFKNTADTKDP